LLPCSSCSSARPRQQFRQRLRQGSGVVPSDASQVNLAHEKHHEKGPLAVFFALKKEAAEAAGQESTGSEPSSQSPGGEEAKKVLVHVKYTKEGESEFKKIKGIIEGLSEPETIKHGKEGGKDKDEKEGGKDKDDKEGGKDKDDKEGGKDEDGNPSSKTGQDADSKDEKKPEHRFEYEAKAIVESEAAWKKMVTKLEAMTHLLHPIILRATPPPAPRSKR